MKNIFKILFTGIMIICFGCGKPRIQTISKDSVIVAFGDSLTNGVGANSDETYPAVLSKLLGIEVINAGTPGEDTTDGLQRLPSVLEKYKPSLVILCHGGNDMLQKQNSQTTIKNINAMISMIKDNNSDVILVGVPRPALILKTAKFCKEIAKQNNIPYEGKIITKVLSTPSLKSDRVHPNDKGYKQIAQAIAALINHSK